MSKSLRAEIVMPQTWPAAALTSFLPYPAKPLDLPGNLAYIDEHNNHSGMACQARMLSHMKP
eukprot:363913-Chlamydomonas_euryale.AAC.8